MLHFVIPFRSAKTSKNWGETCRLLERTVSSAANQPGQSVRIWVVCHEPPEHIQLPDTAKILEVPFAPPDTSVCNKDMNTMLWHFRTDKGRKALYGLEQVRTQKDAYVMFLDADDLVSSRLAGFVHSKMGANGWYIHRGYRWDQETPRWLFPRKRFNHECGSSYILKADRAPFPERVDYSLDYSDYYIRRYNVHAYIADAMRKADTPISALPFPGAVYTFNSQNIFARTLRPQDPKWKQAARILIKGKRIDAGTRAEFGLIELT